jgi:hypothetical protein
MKTEFKRRRRKRGDRQHIIQQKQQRRLSKQQNLIGGLIRNVVEQIREILGQEREAERRRGEREESQKIEKRCGLTQCFNPFRRLHHSILNELPMRLKRHKNIGGCNKECSEESNHIIFTEHLKPS